MKGNNCVMFVSLNGQINFSVIKYYMKILSNISSNFIICGDVEKKIVVQALDSILRPTIILNDLKIVNEVDSFGNFDFYKSFKMSYVHLNDYENLILINCSVNTVMRDSSLLSILNEGSDVSFSLTYTSRAYPVFLHLNNKDVEVMRYCVSDFDYKEEDDTLENSFWKCINTKSMIKLSKVKIEVPGDHTLIL